MKEARTTVTNHENAARWADKRSYWSVLSFHRYYGFDWVFCFMTPATLTLIRKAEKQSISAFAVRLGISRNTLGGYERGLQPIPNYIALACTAIYRRMEAIE